MSLGEIGTTGFPPRARACTPREVFGTARVLSFVHRPCRAGKGAATALRAFIDQHHMVAGAQSDEGASP